MWAFGRGISKRRSTLTRPPKPHPTSPPPRPSAPSSRRAEGPQRSDGPQPLQGYRTCSPTATRSVRLALPSGEDATWPSSLRSSTSSITTASTPSSPTPLFQAQWPSTEGPGNSTPGDASLGSTVRNNDRPELPEAMGDGPLWLLDSTQLGLSLGEARASSRSYLGPTRSQDCCWWWTFGRG